MIDGNELARLRAKYGDAVGSMTHDPAFARVAASVIGPTGTRSAPFIGLPTLLDTVYRPLDPAAPDFGDLQVALYGIPMDLGVTNRSGSRFGPRAVRTIERVGPYEHVLKCLPTRDLRVADIGDIPFRSRYSLDMCHADIEHYVTAMVAAGVTPLGVGGDHSVTLPILKAIGKDRPVALIHFDAHCDTGGPFDFSKFHHGGPFRQAVLEGVLDPTRTIQIGIRGSSEFFWEFSYDSGMTVVHAEEISTLGIPAIIAKARAVVGDAPVYVSFDVDCLDPVFAPGTGTPEIGGVTTREALELLRGLAGLDIIAGDVVEVAPQYDATTNTAHAAAQLLFEILALMVFSPSIGRKAG
ncbi:MAG: agmatinase [Azospirillaceae bacterium]|nr:agmatinase [Azospirillaceae bacterium]